MIRDLAADAAALRALHRPGEPLVLPNVWDAASAGWVREAGYPALATASAAVAESLGYADGEQTPVDEFFAATRRIADRIALPITMDCESGHGLEPAELVRRLTDAGAVGLNLEDTEHAASRLIDADTQAGRIATIRAAATELGVPVVINARTDVFLGVPEPSPEVLAKGIRRAIAYRDAGADCLYPILLRDDRAIAEFVAAVESPVNILRRPGTPTITRLAQLGVARISFGPGVFRATVAAARAMLESLD